MSTRSRSTTASAGGGSPAALLGIAFIILKLCGVIDWSWWWVAAPLWGPVALLAVLALFFALVALVASVFD